MNHDTIASIHARVDTIYRNESRFVFATLIRLLGDLELAEEALHDAFKVALEQWPRDGIPANPRAWLISVGRFKGIDRLQNLLVTLGQAHRRRFSRALIEFSSGHGSL